MTARVPSHLRPTDRLRPCESRAARPSIGLEGRTDAKAFDLRRWERQGIERNSDWITVPGMSDERGAVLHADEAGAAIVVHHGMVWLEVGGRPELQLQELCARDCFQAERIHARKVRQRVLASSQFLGYRGGQLTRGRGRTRAPRSRWLTPWFHRC
jgi:hypothetical protein